MSLLYEYFKRNGSTLKLLCYMYKYLVMSRQVYVCRVIANGNISNKIFRHYTYRIEYIVKNKVAYLIGN